MVDIEENTYTAELQEEKRKDYRNVVGVQAILLMICLLLDDFMRHETVTFLLFQVCAAVYLALLWDLSRNFTFKKWLPKALGWLAVLVVATSVGYNLLFWTMEQGRYVNACLHIVTIWIQFVVMSLGLRDLVNGPRNASDKLWAAAGLYLMLGILFGELIHTVHLFRPETLGPTIKPSVHAFHEALYASFATLTGADNELQGSHLYRNLLVFESLLAQLYMVLLISRLMQGDSSREVISESRRPALEGSPAPARPSGSAQAAGAEGGLQSAPGVATEP